ncbi:hypothetical protein M2G84_06330 [Vibrio vulnificus]|nr:hypothetical protein [Vibrio vulnificus]
MTGIYYPSSSGGSGLDPLKFVPKTRLVNGHQLSEDVNIKAADINNSENVSVEAWIASLEDEIASLELLIQSGTKPEDLKPITDRITALERDVTELKGRRFRVELAKADASLGYIPLGTPIAPVGGLSQFQYIEIDGYVEDRVSEIGRVYGFTGRVSVEAAKAHGYALIYQSGMFPNGGNQVAYIRDVTEQSFEVFCQSNFRYTAVYGVK